MNNEIVDEIFRSIDYLINASGTQGNVNIDSRNVSKDELSEIEANIRCFLEEFQINNSIKEEIAFILSSKIKYDLEGMCNWWNDCENLECQDCVKLFIKDLMIRFDIN